MVLKTTTAKFEDTENTETAAPEAPVSATVTALPTVAAPKSTALARPAKVNMDDFDVLATLENRLPPVGFGEGVRLVGSNGNLMDGDKALLGESIDLLLLSWNRRWVVSPGTESGDAEGKEKARYSLDGVTTSQGENLQDYLQSLKEDGYPKAAVKEYVDLFGVLTGAKKPSKHIDDSVTVSLAPSSAKGFMALRRNLVVKGMMGKLPVSLTAEMGLPLRVTTEVKSAGSLTWTQLSCELALPEEKKAA